MAEFGVGISHSGIFHEMWQYPFYLKAGIVKADEGKAVTLDASANRTVKLAGDGDPILGRLEIVEDRSGVEGTLVGTVSLKGGMKFPIKTGETVAVGNTIQGAGAGEVKALAVSQDTAAGGGAVNIAHASHDARNIVTAVAGGFAETIVL